MKVDRVAIYVYIISILCINIAYLAVFIGIFAKVPTLVKYLNIGIQFLLCSFLMIRFHPFRENYKLKAGDTMFIFGSAVLLFTNLVLVEMVQIPTIGKYINEVFKYLNVNTNIATIQVSVNGNTILTK